MNQPPNPDSLRRLEISALVGCSDAECAAIAGLDELTPELLAHVREMRAYGASQIPKPSEAAQQRAKRQFRYSQRTLYCQGFRIF